MTRTAVKARATKTRSLTLGLPTDWPELIDLTPEIAKKFLSDYHFPGQRALKDGVVRKYTRQILLGDFEPSEIRLFHLGDRVFMTNGYHRCHAVIQAGKAIRANVYHRTVNDFQSVVMDYVRVDGQARRNRRDKEGAAGLIEESGLNARQYEALSAGISHMLSGYLHAGNATRVQESITDEMRFKAIREWIPEGRTFWGAAEGAQVSLTQAFTRLAVPAVAIVTFRYQPEKAFEFWSSVAQNDGLRKGLPAHTLIDFLHRHKAEGAAKSFYSRSVATAWNAFYEGRPLSLIKVINPSAPMKISGTPYLGKKHIFPLEQEAKSE